MREVEEKNQRLRYENTRLQITSQDQTQLITEIEDTEAECRKIERSVMSLPNPFSKTSG